MKETKKQAEARRAAEREREAALWAALHWTDPAPGPDVAPPESFAALSTGFLFNAYSDRVDVACSSGISHAVGSPDRVQSQGSRRLYSSRLLALRALRNAIERQCAERLYAIDRLIAKESDYAN